MSLPRAEEHVPISGRAQRQADDAQRRFARAVRAEAAYLRSLIPRKAAAPGPTRRGSGVRRDAMSDQALDQRDAR
jgi:hypothetical protein